MVFTQISDVIQSKSDVPNNLKPYQGKISTYMSDVITYVTIHFQNGMKYKRKIIDLLNSISLYVISNDAEMDKWDSSNPVDCITIQDSSLNEHKIKSVIQNLYIDISDVQWDVSSMDMQDSVSEIAKPMVAHHGDSTNINAKTTILSNRYVMRRNDISLLLPKYPMVNYNKIWKVCMDKAGRSIPIYTTIPEIPMVQNQISLTTDITKLSNADLLKMFPNFTIPVRRTEMYTPINGYDFDPILGHIPHIDGFSVEQIKTNLIEYPQFSYMYRMVNGEQIPFVRHIEIDGNLIPVDVAMQQVTDMKALPHNKYYVWDYIIRRYILERDIKHITHKYPLVGSFKPFLTLFTTPEQYKKFGYSDSIDLAHQCVMGRIEFYQSRNPLVRGD